MRYITPQLPKIELTETEYKVLDNARKILTEMREKLVNGGIADGEEFVVYDEYTDMDSVEMYLADLTQANKFLNDIV